MVQAEILLVGDDPDDEALTLRALKQSGLQIKVTVAHDGAEALAHLQGKGGESGGERVLQPHMVLLDLKLPRISGLDVLRRLREDERTRRLPVIVFTSSKEEQDLVASYSLGANSYIRKPVDFGEFAQVVRQLGAYWLTLNELPSRRSA